ncbi:hypothetical protein ACWEOE_31765 [Amycolatopsis sp. NPDC004368]
MSIENRQAHADYCARADNHDGACEAPDWYPRQEDGEPRVPEIRWIPNIGAYAKVGGAWYSLEVDMSRPLTLPADAVQLAPVGEDPRITEARAVVAIFDGLELYPQPKYDERFRNALKALGDLRAILDCAPARCAREIREALSDPNRCDYEVFPCGLPGGHEGGHRTIASVRGVTNLDSAPAREERSLILGPPDFCEKCGQQMCTPGGIPIDECPCAARVDRARAAREEASQQASCGRADADCGQRGGSAHCGGCRG